MLARNFRTGIRCMCKKPDHIDGAREWNEEAAEKEKALKHFTGGANQQDVPSQKDNVVKPQPIGTSKFDDNIQLNPPPPENPIHRTGRILADEFRSWKHYFPFSLLSKEKKNLSMVKHMLPSLTDMYETAENPNNQDLFPSHVDICIIGGGAIGSSIAYFLKEKAAHGLNICVLEKDKSVSI